MFWERFVQECKKIGKKPNPVAKELGISSGTITGWKNGSIPNTKALNLLSKYFGVSVDYLLGKTSPPTSPSILGERPLGDLTTLPILAAVRAGYGVAAALDFDDDIAVPDSMLHGYPRNECFVVVANGSSMYPRICDGDYVIAHRQESVDSGDVAIISYDNEATIKKVEYVYGEDWLVMIPFNPEYEPKRIEGDALESCHVIGKVIGMMRTF